MDASTFVPGDISRWFDGVRIPPLIIGDTTYPLREWLIRPYGSWTNAHQQHFNTCLVHARNVMECTFGRLRARWQCLTARLAVAEENITSVIIAFTVLHNLCEEKGHILLEDASFGWLLPCPPPDADIQYIDRWLQVAGTLVQDILADHL